MDYIFFEVPVDPRGKVRPRFTRGGQTYTPRETRAYEQFLRDWYMQRIRGGMVEGPMVVTLNFLMPIPASWSAAKRAAAMRGNIKHDKKPDIDNLVKAVLDAYNGVIWADDKQIIAIKAEKRYSVLPRVCVDVQKADAKAAESASDTMDV